MADGPDTTATVGEEGVGRVEQDRQDSDGRETWTLTGLVRPFSGRHLRSPSPSPEAPGCIDVSPLTRASQCLCERLRRPCFDHRRPRQGAPDQRCAQRWQGPGGHGLKVKRAAVASGLGESLAPPLHRLGLEMAPGAPNRRRRRGVVWVLPVLVLGGKWEETPNGVPFPGWWGWVLSQAPVRRSLAGSGIPRALTLTCGDALKSTSVGLLLEVSAPRSSTAASCSCT